MKAIHYKKLQQRTGTQNKDIMNNWWIVEAKRGLIPFHPDMFPCTSIKHHAIDMVKYFYGPKFRVLHIPIAYLPKDLINDRY